MFMKTKLQVLALLLLAPLLAQAGNLPTASIANTPGLSVHFTTGSTQDLDMIAAAGVKVVRTDLNWGSVEYQKGVYDWSAYDTLVANIISRGMRPYLILDYSNSLYAQVVILSQNGTPYAAYITPPNTPATVAAFAAFAKAAAVHFQSKNVIWEIWNEPNLAQYWQPTPNVTDYSTLASATCSAIHGAVPTAAVVGGVTSGMDWNFLYAFLGSGALSCIDGVSVHPYRAALPETVTNDYQYLQWLIAQYTPSGRGTIPVVSSEWGYSTETTGVPLNDEANYLVRVNLMNLLNNIPVSIWYDWKNDGTDATYNEDNFGIVTATLQVKPAYTAMQTMTTQLAGFTLLGRITLSDSQDYVLLFANSAGKQKAVVWTTDSNHSVTLLSGITSNGTVSFISTLGATTSQALGKAGLSVPLTAAPMYIDMTKL